MGNHSADFENFEGSQTVSLASPSKFSKNYESTTANIRMLGEKDSSSMESLESKLESSYITFLDSDDCLEKFALEHIAKHLQDKQPTIFISNVMYQLLDGEKKLYSHHLFPRELEDRLHSTNDIIEKVPDALIVRAFAFVIRADILGELTFIPNIIYEDVPFCTEIFLRNKEVYLDSTPIYNYVLSQNSITRSEGVTKSYKHINSLFAVIKYFESVKNSNYPFIKNEVKNKFCDENIKYFSHQLLQSLKQILKDLQYTGYNKELDFSKQDLAQFLPYIKGRRRFCYHFPKIYGFPKRLRLFLKSLLLDKA